MLTSFHAGRGVEKNNCEVCDVKLTYADGLLTKDLEYTVCQSFNCKRIMSQKSSMAPSIFKSYIEFNKKIIRQQHEKNEIKKNHTLQVTESEKIENHEVYEFFIKEYYEQLTSKPYKLIIPSGNPLNSLVSDERVSAYVEHLKNIILKACEYSSVSDVKRDEHSDAYSKRLSIDYKLDSYPQLRIISDNVCTMCKGGCCASGKEHAYLSVFSIRRFMDENPHLTAEQVLDLYVSRIGTRSINESCINHTETGCMLPRYLRSDICNSYYCDSLKTYRQKMLGKDVPQAIMAIQRSNTYWNRFEEGVKNKIVKLDLIKY